MSAAERNRYVSPLRGTQLESTSAPSPTPAGTFGTAPRFATPGQNTRARSPLPGYGAATSGTAMRRGGYAEMAQARAKQTQGAALAPRSKTPAAMRFPGPSMAAYTLLPRRAVTPPSRMLSHHAALPAASTGGPTRRAVTAIGGTAPSQQPITPGLDRRTFSNAAPASASARSTTPGRAFQAPATPRAAPLPPSTSAAGGRPSAAPGDPRAPTSRAQRPAYGNSPFVTSHAAVYPAGPGASSAGGVAAPPGSGQRSQARSSARAQGNASGGRFKEPAGDDWLSAYEKSSIGLLRELERVLGGLTRMNSLSPAPMEAGAPPRQLPLQTAGGATDTGTALGSAAAPPAVPAAAGQASTSVMATSNSGAGRARADAWGAHQDAGAAALPHHARPARAEPPSSAAASLSHVSVPAPPQQPPALLAAAYTYPHGAAVMSGAIGEATNAAMPFTLSALIHGPVTISPDGAAVAGLDAQKSGGAARAAVGQPAGLGVQPATATSAAPQPSAVGPVQPVGDAGPSPLLVVPPGTISELWGVLQTCQSTTTRLMGDLAAARREVEIANERAEEADGLARAFQQQLVARQRSVATWQLALAEMEEREAAARQQLADAQARCGEQSKRAQTAEHVAAAVQLHLERIMAQQETGSATVGPGAAPPHHGGAQQQQTPPGPVVQVTAQAAGAGAGGGQRPSTAPDGAANSQQQQREEGQVIVLQQQQQQLEVLQMELAAARTRATRAELELGVARNRALIAQQELSAEEERARRTAAAAAAARQELGRTRSALELLGRDHDRLQRQLQEVRGKLEDAAAPGSTDSDRRDLIAAADQQSPQLRAQSSAQRRTALPPPPPPVGLPSQGGQGAAARADSLPRRSASPVGGAAAGGRAAAGDSRATRMATPGGVSERATGQMTSFLTGRRVVGSSDGSISLVAGSGGAADLGAGTMDDYTLAPPPPPLSRPQEWSLSSSARRAHRQGSVLLVPPSEMPAETCASVRYGNRVILRQRSRSHIGLTESPPRNDDGSGGGGELGCTTGAGAAAGDTPSRYPSPRAMAESHDGVVRRLDMDAGLYDSIADKHTDGTGDGGGGGGAHGRAGGGGVIGQLSLGMTAEEMLPLSRTPSSGRRPSLRFSQANSSSNSRDAPLPSRVPPPSPHHQHKHQHMPSAAASTCIAAAAAAARGAAAPGVPTPTLSADASRPEGSGSGRTLRRPQVTTAAALPEESSQLISPCSSAEQLESVAPTAASATSQATRQKEQQQQRRGGTQEGGGVSVSLADLRRQLAAAQRQQTAPPSSAELAAWADQPAPLTTAAAAAPAVVSADRDRSPLPQQQPSPRQPFPQPFPQPRRQQLRAQESEPWTASPPRAAPSAAEAATAKTCSSPAEASDLRARLPLLKPLPPLERSKSPRSDSPREPTWRPTADGEGDVPSSRPSPIPRGTGLAPRSQVRAVAAAPVPERPAAAAAARFGGGVAAAATVVQNRSHTAATAAGVVPSTSQPSSRLGSSGTAFAADTSVPRGYRTSHINDLYESTSQLLSQSLRPAALQLEAAAASPPPRGLRWQDQVTAAAPPPPPNAGGAPRGRSAAAPAQNGDSQRPQLAFTPRSRMLNPSQVGSYLVDSPSVTNSLATAAAAASIDGASVDAGGSLPVAAAAHQQQPLLEHQQQRQMRHHIQQQLQAWREPVATVPLLGSSSAADVKPRLSAAQGFAAASAAARPAAAAAAAAMAVPATPQPAGCSSPAATTGASLAAAAAGPEARVLSAGMAAAKAAASSSDACGLSPARRRWWQRLLPLPPRRRRTRASGRDPGVAERQCGTTTAAAAAATVAPRFPDGHCASTSHSPPWQLLERPGVPAGGGSYGTLPLRAQASLNAADRPAGCSSSMPVEACGAMRGAGPEAGYPEPDARSRQRSGGGVGGGGGRGGGGGSGAHLAGSVLLHLGMWSGGVAVGVLLVLGVAGLVEGTLGLRADAQAGGTGGRNGRGGRALCGCPWAPESGSKQRSQRDAHGGGCGGGGGL